MAATTGVVVALDQATKQLAIASVEPGRSENVFFGHRADQHAQPRAWPSGRSPEGGLLVAVLIAVALLGLLVFFATHADTPWLWLPTGMLLGRRAGQPGRPRPRRAR